MTESRGRIVGVDVTRGLAVLGMATAHVGDIGEWGEPTGLLHLADGRSAATFAMLAGVSIGLLSGGRTPGDLTVARARIATRAVVIGFLGLVLMSLGTPVVVILPSYAVMFLLALPVLGTSPWRLAALAAGWLAVGATVHELLRDAAWAHVWPVSILVGPYYPVVVWTAYLFAGLAVVRGGLLDRPGRLAGIGAGLGLVGYGVGAVAALASWPTAGGPLDLTPHSSTAPEVLGNLGLAFVVLAGAIVLGRRIPGVLAPLAATGALALTAYTGQIVAIAVLGRDVVFDPSNTTLAVFLLVTVAACWAWRARFGRGPLERLVHGASVSVGESFRTIARTEP